MVFVHWEIRTTRLLDADMLAKEHAPGILHGQQLLLRGDTHTSLNAFACHAESAS